MGTSHTKPLAARIRRVLPTLAVVLAVLAASGWLPRSEGQDPSNYATQLQQWQEDEIAGVALPDPGAAPAEITDWFGSIGHRKQELLAERYPLVVGNLDGVPPEIRYAANRHALAKARDEERERLANGGLSTTGQEEATRRMDRFASLLDEERKILAFDPTGRGRVAEVFGDLDEAERVSVVVPGVHTDLLTFERTRLTYRAPEGMARALRAEQSEAAPGRETAVIAWADYTTPSGMGMSAATGDLAGEGAARLADAVAGLPQGSSVALFCHSYGSVVCGVAAPELSGRVTDIAVAGSPGMRATHASDLGSDTRVWAARAGNDWIADVPSMELGPLGHGQDPAHPTFGARHISAERADGHNGYFVPGTDSLAGFARIGTGTTGPGFGAATGTAEAAAVAHPATENAGAHCADPPVI